MNGSFVKLAPTVVILAAASACAWPYVGEAGPVAGATAAAKAGSEVPLALLTTAPPPRPERDPFQDRELLRAQARAKLAELLKGLVKPRGAPKKGAPGQVAKAGAKPAGAKRAEVDPRDGLVLRATSVHGTRGVAVINGHTYATGDLVRDARPPEPCVLAEVRPDSAILLFQGERFPLGYPIPTGRPSRSGNAVTATQGGLASALGAKPPTGPARKLARKPAARKRNPPKN
jgi:hypothetical protein